MLFSRRKRATAVEPTAPAASVHANGAAPDVALDEDPTLEGPPLFADPLDPLQTVVTSGTGAPTVAVAAPSATPSPSDPPEGLSGIPLAPGDETGDADLDQFFAALRQVVHDARERLPLESDRLDAPDVGADTPDHGPMPPDDSTIAKGATTVGTMVPTRPDPVAATDLAPTTTTELAPSTAELIASLEADRDLWRERAVVWRERAMGADMLVKTLNAHMSDLQINLEDLRLAMRVMSANTPVPPEPRAELPAQTPRRSGIDRLLEPGN
jgi:hypothetical protein